MQLAQQRDALRHQKFHFRKSLSTSKEEFLLINNRIFIFNIVQTPDTPCMASVQKKIFPENECEHRLMTINEIINGSVNFLISLFNKNKFSNFRMNLLVF
jgi:hypothetical protein